MNEKVEKVVKPKKEKLVVNFPKGAFTIEDLQAKHPNAVNITLRFRLQTAITNKLIVAIGTMKKEIGRPQLVFTKTPVLNDTLIKAQSSGVMLNTPYSAMVVEALEIRNGGKQNTEKKVVEPVASESTEKVEVAA